MTHLHPNSHNGRFGNFGGQYVPETLMQPLVELERAFALAQQDVEFQKKLGTLLTDFVGRETPLYLAERLSQSFSKNLKIYLKREDLAHTGAHKINNALGQVLLAKKMGKTRIIAETGAGQHGVATAAVAARFGMKCVVYMGADDIARQDPNVRRMKIFGAEVVAVATGSRTLKDAVSEALRDWVTHVDDSAYILGSALGPHPYPLMVREFQSVIGHEARRQILAKEGRLPDEVVACVGGGSNAIGIFQAFLQDSSVAMTGVEAGGSGQALGMHAARFQGGSPGVFQGTATYLLQDQDGQIARTQSISAGLDYAAVGPEHADLFERGRVKYLAMGDQEALAAFHLLSQQEGILPALESSHALAYALQRAAQLPENSIIVVNLSGRGDKDLDIVEAASQGEICKPK